MKPLIGITTNNSTNSYGQPTVLLQQSYVRAIIQAGGVPVLIPSAIAEDGWDALYARLDGILLSGGGDIAPLVSIEDFRGTSGVASSILLAIRIPASMTWTRRGIRLN